VKTQSSAAPKNEVYRTAYYRVRFTDASMHVTKGRNLLASGDEQGALVELLRANEIDPTRERDPGRGVESPRAAVILQDAALDEQAFNVPLMKALF